MIALSSNGHEKTNGHSKHGIDLGLRDEQPKPCCKLLGHGGRCMLVDGHEGICHGPARRYGPEESIWYQHRGQLKICGKVTSPSTLCGFQRGHYGACK